MTHHRSTAELLTTAPFRGTRRGTPLSVLSSSLAPPTFNVQLTSPTKHHRLDPPGSLSSLFHIPATHHSYPLPSLRHRTVYLAATTTYWTPWNDDTKCHETPRTAARLANAGERGEHTHIHKRKRHGGPDDIYVHTYICTASGRVGLRCAANTPLSAVRNPRRPTMWVSTLSRSALSRLSSHLLMHWCSTMYIICTIDICWHLSLSLSPSELTMNCTARWFIDIKQSTTKSYYMYKYVVKYNKVLLCTWIIWFFYVFVILLLYVHTLLSL